ncbi:MAG: hypothetical protein ACI4RA_06400 [Kiritimatiellia bacterium]
MKVLKMLAAVSCGAVLAVATGCATTTHYVPQGGTVAAVGGFSQDDVDYTVSQAVQSILAQGRLRSEDGSRKVVIVENVVNDTFSRGSQADALAEALGLSLRENLTNSGKIIVYNKRVAQFATVRVDPQFTLLGRLTQRNLRQDNGDVQIEYSLNLQLIELSTGLEFWQKRVPLRKIADPANAM